MSQNYGCTPLHFQWIRIEKWNLTSIQGNKSKLLSQNYYNIFCFPKIELLGGCSTFLNIKTITWHVILKVSIKNNYIIFCLLVFPLSVACQVERKKGYMISYLERAGDSLISALPFVSCDLSLFSSTMIVAYTRVIHCLIYRQTSGKSSPPPLEVSPFCEWAQWASCDQHLLDHSNTNWVSCSYFRKLCKHPLSRIEITVLISPFWCNQILKCSSTKTFG